MNLRTKLAAAMAMTAVATGSATGPAGADTTSQMTLTSSGSLAISEPTGTTTTPVSLGTTASKVGTWTTGALGTVTVSDTRTGLLSNTWTGSATVSDFAYQGTAPTSATAAQKTIAASSMVYNVGTTTLGSGGAVDPVFTAVGGAIAANAVTAGSMVAAGTNSVSWSPTFTVTLANQLAGTYRGTIVHSAI